MRITNKSAAKARTALAPWLFLAVILIAWKLASLHPVWKIFLPSPGTVLRRLGQEISRPLIWTYLQETVLASLAGALLGALVAVPLAWIIYKSRWVSSAVNPFLGATQAIPAVAIAPLLVLWVPSSFGSIVVLCSIMVFFPILVSTTVGLRHLDSDVINAARLDGAWGISLWRYMELPLVLPSLMAGIRNGVTLSVTGAVVGEVIMGGHGMGNLITMQSHNIDIAGMFVSLLVIVTYASVLYLLVYQIEKRSKTIGSLEN